MTSLVTGLGTALHTSTGRLVYKFQKVFIFEDDINPYSCDAFKNHLASYQNIIQLSMVYGATQPGDRHTNGAGDLTSPEGPGLAPSLGPSRDGQH